jgi:hypothetical protein
VSQLKGVQYAASNPKVGHKLPFTLLPFQVASLSPIVNRHADQVRTLGLASAMHLHKHFSGQVEIIAGKAELDDNRSTSARMRSAA